MRICLFYCIFIPVGNCANVATARTGHGVDRLLHQYDDANKLLSGMTKNNIRLGKVSIMLSNSNSEECFINNQAFEMS